VPSELQQRGQRTWPEVPAREMASAFQMEVGEERRKSS